MKRILSNNKGLTLMEVICSFVLFTIITVGFVSVFGFSMMQTARNNAKTVATAEGRAKADNVLNELGLVTVSPAPVPAKAKITFDDGSVETDIEVEHYTIETDDEDSPEYNIFKLTPTSTP